jgi:hypothetical protein
MARRVEMGTPTIKRNEQGTIQSIRDVRVTATSTKFAMVTPDGGSCKLAIRIGLNITAEGDAFFLVGDKVKYTVMTGSPGEPPRAQDLVKFRAGSAI